MSTRTLPLAFVLLLVALGMPGCGTGGDDAAGGARRGAQVFALPFLPAPGAEVMTLGFKNPTPINAPVHVTRYMPVGGAYPGGTSTFTVPAQGELRLAVVGGGGGRLDPRRHARHHHPRCGHRRAHAAGHERLPTWSVTSSARPRSRTCSAARRPGPTRCGSP